MPAHTNNVSTMIELAANIKVWGAELGFQQVGITDVALQEHEARLNQWLANGYHGELGYMAHHGSKRSHPEELLPGTLRVISVRLDYLTTQARVSKHEQQAQKPVAVEV